MAEVRSKMAWHCDEIKALVGRKEALIAVRRAFVLRHWDDVFMYTERAVETKARRLRRVKLLDLLKKRGAGAEVVDAIMGVSDPFADPGGAYRALAAALQEAEALSRPRVRALALRVEGEIAKYRAEAFNRYAQFLLVQAMKVGRAASAAGEVSTENTSTDHLDVVFAEVYLLSLADGSGAVAYSTSLLRDRAEFLSAQRARAMAGDWQLLLAAPDSSRGPLRLVLFSSDVLSELKSVEEELEGMRCAARNKLAHAGLVAALSYSQERRLGSQLLSAVGLGGAAPRVAEAIAAAKRCSEGEHGAISPALRKLLLFAEALEETRAAFAAPAAHTTARAALQDFQSLVQRLRSADVRTQELPAAAQEEIACLQARIQCNATAEAFNDFFASEPSGYFVKAAPSSSSSSKDLLGAAGMQLNPLKVGTEQLQQLMASIDEAREGDPLLADAAMTDESASLQMAKMRSACECLLDLRQQLAGGQWGAAARAVDRLQAGGLCSLPPVQAEVDACAEHIDNYRVHQLCEDFVAGQSSQLPEAEAAFSAMGSCFESTRQKVEAVRLLADLRDAVKGCDFDRIDHMLALARRSGVGAGATASCKEELDAAQNAREDAKCLQELCEAISAEALVQRGGLVATDCARWQTLAAAVKKVRSEHPTARAAMAYLLQLADLVLKMRRAFSQSEWFTIKSLMPLLKEEVDNFVGALGISATAAPTGRATRRRSILHAEPAAPANSLLVRQFAVLHECLLDEMRIIDQHFEILRLEADLLTELRAGGVTFEMIGRIEPAVISTRGIRRVLERKAALELANCSFSEAFLESVAVARSVVAIREAIIANQWGELKSLLEQVTLTSAKGSIPPSTKQELQVVRHETESRWMVAALTEELLQGCALGAPGDLDLRSVEFHGLQMTHEACRVLKPRTYQAISLVHTAGHVAPLREALLEPEVDWRRVGAMARALLSQDEVFQGVVAEVQLIADHAEVTVLCDDLARALGSGRLRGDPGAVDLSGAGTQELRAALEASGGCELHTGRKKELHAAGALVLAAREAFLHIGRSGLSDDVVWHADWRAVKDSVLSIFDLKAAAPFLKHAWPHCKQEAVLLLDHLHLLKMHRGILESVTSNADALQRRKDSNPSLTEVSDKASQWRLKVEVTASCKSLQDLMQDASKQKSAGEALGTYISCASALVEMRTALIKGDLELVMRTVEDRDFRQRLAVVQAAQREYEATKVEVNNRQAISMLYEALKPQAREGEPSMPPASALSAVVRRVEAVETTSGTVDSLLLCARQLCALRTAVAEADYPAVLRGLAWFSENEAVCPPAALEELRAVHVHYQNRVLEQGLLSGLAAGGAGGSPGQLQLEAMDSRLLAQFLQEGKGMTSLSAPVQHLLQTAEAVHMLRLSQLSRDPLGVGNALSLLASWDLPVPDVVRAEVVLARADLNDRLAVMALQDALSAPACSDGAAALDAAMYSCWELFADPANGWRAISPEAALLPLPAEAVALAEALGARGAHASRLYHAAKLITVVRRGVSEGRWQEVQTLLDRVFSREDVWADVDRAVERELLTARLQASLRSEMLRALQALSSGAVLCSSSLVLADDVVATELQALQTSIEAISLLLLKLTPQQSSATKEHMLFFLQSARAVEYCRRLLLAGDAETAGEVARDSLQRAHHASTDEELQTYLREVYSSRRHNDMLRMLAQSIRDVDDVAGTIDRVVADERSDLLDLGMVRQIEQAGKLSDSIEQTKRMLAAAAESVDPKALSEKIVFAKLLNVEGVELQQAEDRYDAVKEFETFALHLVRELGGEHFTASREACATIVRRARELGTEGHPLARRAEFMTRLPYLSQCVYAISTALKVADPRVAVKETIAIRRAHLSGAHSKRHFVLESFGKLRPQSDFALRMSLESAQLRKSFLTHSSTGIPTSLTRLPAMLATLAVWTFVHCVRGIENHAYSHNGTALLSLIRLGRRSVIMRDELLLQVVKQLRMNACAESVGRLWHLLHACLAHFPPSQQFESYLEAFLFGVAAGESHLYREAPKVVAVHSSVRASVSGISAPPAPEKTALDVMGETMANLCLYKLHESVFLHGYTSVISAEFDSAPDTLRRLLEDEFIEQQSAVRASMADRQRESLTLLVEFRPDGRAEEETREGAAAVLRSRGNRTDWIARFCSVGNSKRLFHEGLGRDSFVLGISEPSAAADRCDLLVLRFIVERTIPNSIAVGLSREYYRDSALLDGQSSDEAVASRNRRRWLEEHIESFAARNRVTLGAMMPLRLLAEAFWDQVIEHMAADCHDFPFIRRASVFSRSGDATLFAAAAKSLRKARSRGTTITWEVYRDLILAGMKLTLVDRSLRRDGLRLQGVSLNDDDYQLYSL